MRAKLLCSPLDCASQISRERERERETAKRLKLLKGIFSLDAKLKRCTERAHLSFLAQLGYKTGLLPPWLVAADRCLPYAVRVRYMLKVNAYSFIQFFLECTNKSNEHFPFLQKDTSGQSVVKNDLAFLFHLPRINFLSKQSPKTLPFFLPLSN